MVNYVTARLCVFIISWHTCVLAARKPATALLFRIVRRAAHHSVQQHLYPWFPSSHPTQPFWIYMPLAFAESLGILSALGLRSEFLIWIGHLTN